MKATKPKVYVESSVISYLIAQSSRDLIVAANQQVTHIWWNDYRGFYDLYASELVEIEVSEGDVKAAANRKKIAKQFHFLEISEGARALARILIERGPLPEKAARDAIHIAVAAIHEIDFLLTWNCRHIANAAMQRSLEARVSEAGYRLPVLCTPHQLIG